MNIVSFSETKKPGDEQIRRKGCTYYWSGKSDGARPKGVAIAISCNLQPSVVGITSVGEFVMLVRLKHTLGFTSLMAVHASTELCELEK